MTNLVKIKGMREDSKDFYEIYLLLQEVLFHDLKSQYRKVMDPATANLLASHVVNFLTGEMEDSQRLDSDRNQLIEDEKIFDQIEARAMQKMEEDDSLRKVIVYMLRAMTDAEIGSHDKKFQAGEQKKRIDNILIKFGTEFPHESQISFYFHLAQDYIARKKLELNLQW